MVERRRYFRINDVVGVAYRVVTEEELANQPAGEDKNADLQHILRREEAAIAGLLNELKEEEPSVAAVLAHMNRKINRVVEHLEMGNQVMEQLAHRVQEVNISACGMAFHTEDKLAAGQTISLDIVLYPTERHVLTHGIVVGVEPSADKQGYYVRVNFKNINIDDQEVLIQHVLQRQGQLIRQQRAENKKK